MGNKCSPGKIGEACLPIVTLNYACLKTPTYTTDPKCKILNSINDLLSMSILKVGDIFVMGSPDHFFAKCVQGITNTNLSHTMIVSRIVPNSSALGGADVYIAEATEFSEANGVNGKDREWGVIEKEISSRFAELIKFDTKSWIFMVPLRQSLYNKHIRNKEEIVYSYVKKHYGKKYDYWAGVEAALDKSCCNGEMTLFYSNLSDDENNRFQCSEFVAGVYRYVGLFPEDFNNNEMLPSDLVMFDVFEDIYFRVCSGDPNAYLDSTMYNSYDPNDWNPNPGLLYKLCCGKMYSNCMNNSKQKSYLFYSLFCLPVCCFPYWALPLLTNCGKCRKKYKGKKKRKRKGKKNIVEKVETTDVEVVDMIGNGDQLSFSPVNSNQEQLYPTPMNTRIV